MYSYLQRKITLNIYTLFIFNIQNFDYQFCNTHLNVYPLLGIVAAVAFVDAVFYCSYCQCTVRPENALMIRELCHWGWHQAACVLWLTVNGRRLLFSCFRSISRNSWSHQQFSLAYQEGTRINLMSQICACCCFVTVNFNLVYKLLYYSSIFLLLPFFEPPLKTAAFLF